MPGSSSRGTCHDAAGAATEGRWLHGGLPSEEIASRSLREACQMSVQHNDGRGLSLIEGLFVEAGAKDPSASGLCRTPISAFDDVTVPLKPKLGGGGGRNPWTQARYRAEKIERFVAMRGCQYGSS